MSYILDDLMDNGPKLNRANVPDVRREATLEGHVEECIKRYVEIRTDIYKIRKVLYLIVAALVGNKFIDVNHITAGLQAIAGNL